jgi:putative membrane protein
MITKKRISVAYIFQMIMTDSIVVLAIGVGVHVFKIYTKDGLPAIPLGVPAFLGTAISILLSFKISQSYERWWEARKIWGAIVNDSRSFVLQLQALLAKDASHEIKRMAYRQIAWCYCLGQSLRGLSPLKNLNQYMSKDDLDAIISHSNKPLAILQLNSEDIQELKNKEALDIFSQLKLNDIIGELTASMGRAERIKNTVFPTTYRLNLHISIYIFLICLTVALSAIPVVYSLSLVLIIGTIFFMLEGSAFNLQDPFENRPSDTAVTAIARTIEINIKQLLKEENVPEALAPESFYLM